MSDILYIHEEQVHNTNAARAFLPFLFKLIQPSSVIDVGCGIGTWLSVLKDMGVSDIMGVDGDYVDRSMLYIKESDFKAADLRTVINLNRKYDLAICLEVAEHLSIDSADTLIKTLVNHSDNILFSAALPKQGGQNHINEQPVAFWKDGFAKYGYKFIDAFRRDIWNIEEIDWWYRQNMFFVSKEEKYLEFQTTRIDNNDYYHPKAYLGICQLKEIYEQHYKKSQTLFGALKLICGVLYRKIFK